MDNKEKILQAAAKAEENVETRMKEDLTRVKNQTQEGLGTLREELSSGVSEASKIIEKGINHIKKSI